MPSPGLFVEAAEELACRGVWVRTCASEDPFLEKAGAFLELPFAVVITVSSKSRSADARRSAGARSCQISTSHGLVRGAWAVSSSSPSHCKSRPADCRRPGCCFAWPYITHCCVSSGMKCVAHLVFHGEHLRCRTRRLDCNCSQLPIAYVEW